MDDRPPIRATAIVTCRVSARRRQAGDSREPVVVGFAEENRLRRYGGSERGGKSPKKNRSCIGGLALRWRWVRCGRGTRLRVYPDHRECLFPGQAEGVGLGPRGAHAAGVSHPGSQNQLTAVLKKRRIGGTRPQGVPALLPSKRMTAPSRGVWGWPGRLHDLFLSMRRCHTTMDSLGLARPAVMYPKCYASAISVECQRLQHV